MQVIYGRNVQEAYDSAMIRFRSKDRNVVETYPSRNGPMIEMVGVAVSIYNRPRERVMFDPVRDCNPYLHFFESLWMLAGKNDLEFVTKFTKNMENFSDDGQILNGAYGYRWSHHFGYNQLVEIIRILTKDPFSRRAVISMWDGHVDLTNQVSKDLPCNLSVAFKLRDGILDMTVFNRSNDAIWGCYGANAVHFSYLQEYIACAIYAQVGTYTQVSNSLHIYPELEVTKRVMESVGGESPDEYLMIGPGPMLFDSSEEVFEFQMDLFNFFEGVSSGNMDWQPMTVFFSTVALPLWKSFIHWKDKNPEMALKALDNCAAPDWKKAATEWIERRMK